MTVDTVLHNAKIYADGDVLKGGVAIDDGKIVKVAKEPNLPPASEKFNLHEYLILPGLIDAHVHLRGQLQAYEEDFFSGTKATASGGFTTVLDMPNNRPVTMNSTSLRRRIRAAEHRIVTNVGFYSAFPNSPDELIRVVKEGAIAFKLYLSSTMGGLDVDDDKALSSAFIKLGELGIPIAVHAEDKAMMKDISEREQTLGHKDIRAYLEAHSHKIEAKAVQRILHVARDSCAQIHFCHISSKEAVDLIIDARRKGQKVSCEVTPHHLLLTAEDLEKKGTMLLTDPPVRSRGAVNKLWNALKNREIDIVASDHAPHLISEKKSDSVWEVKPGIPGLETTLPLLLTEVNEGHMTIAMLVSLMAERPAEIFHLHGHGALKEGYNANITVVDLHRRGKIDASKFYSKAKYSPFDSWIVEGIPVKTFVNGCLVMDEGEIVAEAGIGRILRGKV